MKLIKPFIAQLAKMNVELFCKFTGVSRENLFNIDQIAPKLPPDVLSAYADTLDIAVTEYMVEHAETFLFDSAHIMEFLKSVDRKLKPGDYPFPFNSFIIQFSEPIPERTFLHGVYTSGEEPIEGDTLLGLLVHAPEEGSTIMNVVGIFQSTSINRVAVDIRGGEVRLEPLLKNPSEEGIADKQKLVNLALLCIAYINSPKIVIEKVGANEKVNKKREKKGKRQLDTYYICTVERERTVYPEGQSNTGRHVSYTFPVIGHFRMLPDGKVTWIRPHFRGLEHDTTKNKVYKVK